MKSCRVKKISNYHIMMCCIILMSFYSSRAISNIIQRIRWRNKFQTNSSTQTLCFDIIWPIQIYIIGGPESRIPKKKQWIQCQSGSSRIFQEPRWFWQYIQPRHKQKDAILQSSIRDDYSHLTPNDIKLNESYWLLFSLRKFLLLMNTDEANSMHWCFKRMWNNIRRKFLLWLHFWAKLCQKNIYFYMR